MSTIKNISGEARLVPGLGPFGTIVLEGQSVEVPLGEVTAYTQQESLWAPGDDEATAVHEQMLDDIAELLAAQVVAALDPEDTSAHAVIVALAQADQDTAQAVLETDTRVTVKRAAEARLIELNGLDDVDPDDATDNTPED